MEKKQNIFYGWWIVLGTFTMLSLLGPSIISMANKFLIPVTTEMNISRSAFTLSNTLLQCVGIIFSPFMAKKIAKGNLVKIMSISLIVYSLAFASYGLAQKPIHHYASSLIIGICNINVGLIPVSMMITNWFNKKRGLAMSIAMAGTGVGGFILSPLITSWLANYGWRTTYMIFGALILVICLPISLLVLKKHPKEKGLAPYGENEIASPIMTDEQKGVNLDVKTTFTKPFFGLMMIGMVLNGIVGGGTMGQFPPALEGEFGPVFAASIISIYSIVSVFGKLVLGWVNDKWGVVISSLYGGGTLAFSLILMLTSHSKESMYIMAIFFGLGLAIGTVSPPLITSAIYSKEKYGEVYGYVSSATQIGLTLGSLIVASFYDLSGSYQVAWLLLIIGTVIIMFGWISAYLQSRKYVAESSNK